ncbi:cytochrome P450 [Aspergillus insuetus]
MHGALQYQLFQTYRTRDHTSLNFRNVTICLSLLFLLSDGTTVPQNSILCVSCARMWDPSVYPSPEKLNPYRFLKLRDTPGHESSAQLVSPSPEHMGFELGKHACPERFFAANELKIAFCHILLKYDIRFLEKWKDPKPFGMGLAFSAELRATMQIQRRREEIEL